MTWALLPAVAAWAIVARLVWVFGIDLVGESAAGRKALPIVASLWPLAGFLLALVALSALFDKLVDRLLGDVFGDDDP